MSAYFAGRNAGMLSALHGSPPPAAVSIPMEYLGGDLPKAWDGWTEAAHTYAEQYSEGHALIVSRGQHGLLTPNFSTDTPAIRKGF